MSPDPRFPRSYLPLGRGLYAEPPALLVVALLFAALGLAAVVASLIVGSFPETASMAMEARERMAAGGAW